MAPSSPKAGSAAQDLTTRRKPQRIHAEHVPAEDRMLHDWQANSLPIRAQSRRRRCDGAKAGAARSSDKMRQVRRAAGAPDPRTAATQDTDPMQAGAVKQHLSYRKPGHSRQRYARRRLAACAGLLLICVTVPTPRTWAVAAVPPGVWLMDTKVAIQLFRLHRHGVRPGHLAELAGYPGMAMRTSAPLGLPNANGCPRRKREAWPARLRLQLQQDERERSCSDGIFPTACAHCVLEEFEKSRPIVADSCRIRPDSESAKFSFEIKSANL